MEIKTSTNHENGNDANRLLAAAIIQTVLKTIGLICFHYFQGVEHRTYRLQRSF